MMTAAANGGDGPECVFKVVHRHACFLLGAKPGFGGSLSLLTSAATRHETLQTRFKKTRTPDLGVEPDELVIEILASSFVDHAGKERLEQFDAIRPPGPGPQTAELPLAEIVGRVDAPFFEFDELRRRKPCVLQVVQKARRRPFCQEHNIIRLTEELGQVGEIFGKPRLVLWRSIRFALGEVALGEGVEDKDIGWHSRQLPAQPSRTIAAGRSRSLNGGINGRV